jgi:RNA polymerase sigma-70 factor (ECF subfamily)
VGLDRLGGVDNFGSDGSGVSSGGIDRGERAVTGSRERGYARVGRSVDGRARPMEDNSNHSRYTKNAESDAVEDAFGSSSDQFGSEGEQDDEAPERPPRRYLALPEPRSDETGGELFVRALYAEHADFLLSFVLRLTGGDRHWAEDVLQETMLRAWRHADQLLEGVHRSLLPWLTTVARRIVSNDRRSRRARPQEVDDTMLEVAMVQDETERALQRLVIIKALRGIGLTHREVVVELYLRGRTVEQVAAILNIPPGTVKSRAYYAVRALRAALLDDGVNQDG